MIDEILTSSVLILAVCVVRTLFEKKITPCIKYALWLLVAVKLLVPIPDFETALSIRNVTRGIEQTQAESLFAEGTAVEPGNAEAGHGTANAAPDRSKTGMGIEPREESGLTLNKLAGAVVVLRWTGSGIFAVIFLLSNLSFYRNIRKKRKAAGNYKELKIYEIEGLGSPCLYGVRKPAIYLSSQVLRETENLEYILLHEYTHYRHKDHLWAVIRCLCLVGYWYNPLVWLAAKLSVKDGELACDAGVIRRIGEENRIAYGNTLVDTLRKLRQVPEKGTLLGLSTSMAGGMKDMKKRMQMIVKRPRMRGYTLLLLAAVSLALIGCTYGNAVTREDAAKEKMPKEQASDKQTTKAQMAEERQDAKDFTMEQLLALCADGSEALKKAFTIDGEEGDLPYGNLTRMGVEWSLTWDYRIPLTYEGREYELYASYWTAETAAEYGHVANELDNIYIGYPATGDGQLLYDLDERYTPNLDVQSFLQKEYDIRNYVDFELPAGVRLGAYDVNLNGVWQGCPLEGDFEEPPHGEFATPSWYAPGGIGFLKRTDFPDYVQFENHKLKAVNWNMNHGSRDSEFETLVGCELQAILCAYSFDVFTIPEMEEYKEQHGLEDGDFETTSHYWYVFFAGEDSEYVYTLFLNQAYFSKEDVVKMAKTGKFKK